MTNNEDIPLLLPRPKKITLTGRLVDATVLKNVAIRNYPASHFPSASEECYRIRITPHETTIECAKAMGSYRGLATVKQLARQYPDQVPVMTIEDWPTFATRGVMLDVSRDRVPTMAQLRETVAQLASLKINHLQLYTEHTFAYRGHEEVWQNWSPMTPAEVGELRDWCEFHMMELSANQNCFGHLAKWLNHPKYQHLAETLGDWVFQNETESFPRSGPFSLCPTEPRSIEFVKDLLSQLLPCFNSPLVNIGCDETFDVGWGRSKSEVEQRGRAAVYFDFVNQIADAVRSHGKRPMFWADIALTHPESIPLIPKDMIGLAWGYEPDAKFGEWCSRLREADREVWVCPGTSSWRSITGRTTERRANIRRAAREGSANGATGFLITDWGDSGHHQQWPIALNAIAEAADAAWNADHLDDYDTRATSLHVFDDQSLQAAAWIDQLGDADLAVRSHAGRINGGESPTHLRNSSALFCELHLPSKPGPQDDSKLRRGLASRSVEEWGEVNQFLQRHRGRRPQLSAQLADELEHTNDEAIFATVRAINRREPSVPASDTTNWLRSIITEHRRLWLLRSREGGLEDSCSYYQKVLADITETT